METTEIELLSAAELFGTAGQERILGVGHHLGLEGVVRRERERHLALCGGVRRRRQRGGHGGRRGRNAR